MRYICFLRAINVGGHVVPMAELKKIFESLRLGQVETFIASGNVIFTSNSGTAATLETRIERALRAKLGYDADAFLRTEVELSEIAVAAPFAADAIEGSAAFNVAMTRSVLSGAQREQLAKFDSDFDAFATLDRQIYWICRAKQSGSKFVSAKMERALGLRVTWRNMNTVRRLSAKYPPR